MMMQILFLMLTLNNWNLRTNFLAANKDLLKINIKYIFKQKLKCILIILYLMITHTLTSYFLKCSYYFL